MLIQLVHLRGLGYPGGGRHQTLALPEAAQARAAAGATVISFRPPARGRPDRRLAGVSATDRFTHLAGDDLVLVGLESDSPLAPLILWDLAHAAPVGASLTLMGDHLPDSHLLRPYFAPALQLERETPGERVLRKIRPLPAEADRGLEAWTFGIPVGPEDATLLNAVVRRILDLDIPVKEIVLCGRPGANFAHWEQVRIVGEDIPAPPVRIGAKKNRLAQEASHPNLCILHDRVLLPLDFGRAVRRFGDDYPFTAFQSVFFDDRWHLVPRRYSDMGVSLRARAAAAKGLRRDNDAAQPSAFAPATLALTERAGYAFAHPRRHCADRYLTGSLYLCKRSVWRLCPQDETLHWVEFEDVEQGLRAADAGIPSRINPHSLTQSLIARPLLAGVAGAHAESLSGKVKLVRPWSEVLPLPRKPALKATQDAAWRALQQFTLKYVRAELRPPLPPRAVLDSRARLRHVADILARVELRASQGPVRAFLRDYERWVVMDQIPYSTLEDLAQRIGEAGSSPVRALLEEDDTLVQQVARRPRRGLFCRSLGDFMQPRSWPLAAGTLLSGLYLYLRRRDWLYLDGGPWQYAQALRRSTPLVPAREAAP